MSELSSRIWLEAKPAEEYPKDWYVIPAKDVIELIELYKREEAGE